MNYFVITSLGRQAIPLLEREGKNDEVEILRFLLKGGATAQQISDETLINSSTVYLLLRQFKREKWVKEKRFKGTL